MGIDAGIVGAADDLFSAAAHAESEKCDDGRRDQREREAKGHCRLLSGWES
jgi:hypothetical protein